MWLIPYTTPYYYFMLVVAIIASTSGFFQSYKIYREKTAIGVSLFAWLISVFANLCWLLYGLMIEDYVVTISSAIGLLGSSSVAIFYFLSDHEDPLSTKPLVPSIKQEQQQQSKPSAKYKKKPIPSPSFPKTKYQKTMCDDEEEDEG